MNISEPFIRRPVMTTLVMIAILVLGIYCYNRLPVSNLPDVNYPSINVKVAFPGSSPEIMANNVATPLEKEFMTISGISSVTSANTLGNTDIILQFDIHKSIEAAAQDVEAAITRARSNLPPDLPNQPSYTKVNPSDTPILYIALTSETMKPGDLYNYAHTFIGQRISMLDGVAQVITYGSPFAVRVQVDPRNLKSTNVTLEDVEGAIARGNPSLPTGQLDGFRRSSTIVTKGQLYRANEYKDLVVAYRNRGPVRISDLGTAIDSLQNDRISLNYIHGDRNLPTVVLAVQRQPGANTVRVADSIKAYLPKLLNTLPGSVELITVFDRADTIRESVAEVKFTLMVAFVLVVLVIFLYLGKVSDTIIPSLALPMSIVATFIVMYLMNYTIDNLSLLAFTLAIGFIVDDAIVVLENIVRRIEEGENPWTATLEGSQQISFTILSMTLSLAAVFIPLLFMGGLLGKIFQEFAVTLAVVTIASGIISLTLTPMLCRFFLVSRDKNDNQGRVEKFSHSLNARTLAWYRPKLEWALAHRGLMLFIGALSILFTFVLITHLPSDFIPDDDIGFIIAYSQGAEGTSSHQMDLYQREVASVLSKIPSVDTIVSISSFPQYRQGISFIRLAPVNKRAGSQQIIQDLYKKLFMIPGINVFLKNVPLIDLSVGIQTKGAYQFALQSTDTEKLYQSGEKLLQKMLENPMFQGVSSDLEIKSPQLDVKILRDKAYTYGVEAFNIENTLGLAYSGNRVSRIQTPLDQYDVILELTRPFQREPSALNSIYVRSKDTQALVPLNNVAQWKEGVGPNSINHIGQFPGVTISFNLAPGYTLGDALDKLRQMAKDTLDPVVTGDVQGAAESFEDSIKSSGLLLLMAVFVMYIILGILYESFIHPITILSTLPPAMLGGLLTLFIFGIPLSLYSYLGLLLLIGIVKKNGIMMVDFAIEYQKHQNETPEKAIFHACLARFRPIMMTTICAVMGALPIALGTGMGADARRPLGLIIVGGLLFSQMITLFITPVVYLYMERLNKHVQFHDIH